MFLLLWNVGHGRSVLRGCPSAGQCFTRSREQRILLPNEWTAAGTTNDRDSRLRSRRVHVWRDQTLLDAAQSVWQNPFKLAGTTLLTIPYAITNVIRHFGMNCMHRLFNTNWLIWRRRFASRVHLSISASPFMSTSSSTHKWLQWLKFGKHDCLQSSLNPLAIKWQNLFFFFLN